MSRSWRGGCPAFGECFKTPAGQPSVFGLAAKGVNRSCRFANEGSKVEKRRENLAAFAPLFTDLVTSQDAE
jgi:hypothetical protein